MTDFQGSDLLRRILNCSSIYDDQIFWIRNIFKKPVLIICIQKYDSLCIAEGQLLQD